jgi:hypothetical protein
MKSSSCSLALAAAAALASVAHAQVWGTQGTWQLVLPSPGGAVPNLAFQHAAFVPGTILIMGNGSTPTGGTNDIDLYLFNVATNTWSAPYDYVPQPTVNFPFLFTFGGFAVIIDESAPNFMAYIDSNAGPNSGWTRIAVSGAPIGRVAQRFMVWGSSLYMFGGFNPTNVPPTQSNDMFVLDLVAAVTQPPGGAAVPWTVVSPPVDATNTVPGYPPPRVGYSWTPFDIGSFMYGGISYNAPGGDPFQQCLFVPPTAPVDPNCQWHENLWGLLPSYTANGIVPATAWFRLANQGANGSPTPRGRVLHSSGRMGNQLYVYGGITQAGPTSELWAYDLMSQQWALTTSSGGGPADGGWGIMVTMGFRIFVYSQGYNPVTGIVPNSGQLYVWTPSPFRGGPSSPDSSSSSSLGLSIAYGHTAGIVLGLLLGGLNLYVLVRLAQNSRVDLGCGASAGGGGGKGGAGYYVAAPGGIASAYEAPSA